MGRARSAGRSGRSPRGRASGIDQRAAPGAGRRRAPGRWTRTCFCGRDTITIAGLAQDFIQYITTPAEYGTQSYEGASTLYGKNQATFLQERLVELARTMAAGTPAPAPYPLDTSYGVKPDGPAFGPGAASGTITQEPAESVQRMGKVDLAWTGGPDGTDRPVDAPFVRAERIVGKRWRVVDSDLALAMVWRADAEGRYTFQWQPAATVPTGTYRLRVSATRYELISRTFSVTSSDAARVRSVRRAKDGSARAMLAFPPADADDFLPPPPAQIATVRGAKVRDPSGAAGRGSGPRPVRQPFRRRRVLPARRLTEAAQRVVVPAPKLRTASG